MNKLLINNRLYVHCPKFYPMKKYFALTVLYFYAIISNAQTLPNPILFCTQIPNPSGFGTCLETFGSIGGQKPANLNICLVVASIWQN